MKSSVFLHSLAAVCVAATAASASGQAIQLFGPVNVRTSIQGTGYGEDSNTFNSTILNLSCPASPQGKISSSSDGGGNVLVDNFISLGVGEANPVDICHDGTVEGNGQQNCFNETYKTEASKGTLTGKDPDDFVSMGGVPAIDISSYLSPGTSQVQINLTDTGGYFASSSLYLVTNCTSLGVSGPGQVTGNPIPSSNPTPQQLAQSYSFNSVSNQQVNFTYDLTVAQNAGTLTIPNQSVPSTGDTLLDPATFSSTYLTGTSFATASCLLHNGETLNSSPACKLYTLTCQVGTNPNQAGALCPVSQQRNELFQEVFDGPAFSLPDISGTNGLTYHQGVAFLEANENWDGGSCVFDPASSIASLLCPQNILTSFSGPGAYRSGGSGQSPNSDFITVAPVPEDLTMVKVAGETPQNGYWVNSHSPTVNFVSTPPAVASSNNFVAAPIESLAYGISAASSVPQPPAPVAGDTSLPNPGACPAPGGSAPANVFTPPAQSISVPSDGQYLLHYYAQDCAGTQELKFTQDGSGNWSTAFYTYPVNVDTVPPVVASGPTLSPPPSTNNGVPNSYVVGQAVTANYSCTDDRSGVVKCGAYTFAPGTLTTGNLSSPVSTTTPGSQTFTVTAQDAAGNTANPASVSYQVVQAAPVNLNILKLAPPTVKQNAQMSYVLTAGNLGKQTAKAVVVTDPLPAGVTYVKATAQQLVCDHGKCSNQASCSFSSNTVTCTAPSMTFLTPMLVEIVVSVQASPGTTIKNTATVTSANPEGKGYPQSTATTRVR